MYEITAFFLLCVSRFLFLYVEICFLPVLCVFFLFLHALRLVVCADPWVLAPVRRVQGHGLVEDRGVHHLGGLKGSATKGQFRKCDLTVVFFKV